ncbi:MAG: Mov34/MPN/PAD-1 family protein [Nitrospirae bacterium]|nr:Mov34/MPN/PAD-1 family protein [Nitrospirota bacterium]
MIRLKLNKETLLQIFKHAVSTYPEECCGIVTKNGQTEKVHFCKNIQNELHKSDPERHCRTAATAYAIDRDEAQRIFSEVHASGGTVAAFYHSHPDHEAYFSEEDVAAQTVFGEPEFPDALQIVVSVRLGIINNHKCFYWNGKGFEELT